MRLERIRLGGKFVMEDRGGVWEKLPDGKAKCIFGNRETYGTEIQVPQDAFVYGLFDRPAPRFAPQQAVAVPGGSGVKLVVADVYEGTVLMEVPDASPAQIAAFALVDEVNLRLPRKRNPVTYVVMDTGYDMTDHTLHVMVRLDRSEGVKDDEADAKDEALKTVVEEKAKDELHSGAVQERPADSPAVEREGHGVHFEPGGGELPPVPPANGGTQG